MTESLLFCGDILNIGKQSPMAKDLKVTICGLFIQIIQQYHKHIYLLAFYNQLKLIIL